MSNEELLEEPIEVGFHKYCEMLIRNQYYYVKNGICQKILPSITWKRGQVEVGKWRERSYKELMWVENLYICFVLEYKVMGPMHGRLT
jgi:hypothetical protein